MKTLCYLQRPAWASTGTGLLVLPTQTRSIAVICPRGSYREVVWYHMMRAGSVDVSSPFLKILFSFLLKSCIFILLHAVLRFWARDGQAYAFEPSQGYPLQYPWSGTVAPGCFKGSELVSVAQSFLVVLLLLRDPACLPNCLN